jgi:hypothetical protein
MPRAWFGCWWEMRLRAVPQTYAFRQRPKALEAPCRPCKMPIRKQVDAGHALSCSVRCCHRRWWLRRAFNLEPRRPRRAICWGERFGPCNWRPGRCRCSPADRTLPKSEPVSVGCTVAAPLSGLRFQWRPASITVRFPRCCRWRLNRTRSGRLAGQRAGDQGKFLLSLNEAVETPPQLARRTTRRRPERC